MNLKPNPLTRSEWLTLAAIIAIVVGANLAVALIFLVA